MKNLNDLISQITDEKLLRVLELVAKQGRYYDERQIFHIANAPEVLENWKSQIEGMEEAYETNGWDGYKQPIAHLKESIARLESWQDSAYLFVIRGNTPIKCIDSPESMMEYFKDEK